MTEEVNKNANQEAVSIEDIKKAIGDVQIDCIYVTLGTGDNAVKVLIKKHISLVETAVFVTNVLKMVFVVNEEGDEIYCPQFKDFAFKYEMVASFTNIDLQDRTLPEVELVIYNETLNEAFNNYIDSTMYSLYDAVDDLIQYKVQKSIRQSKFDEALNAVVDTIKALTGKIDDADQGEFLKYMEDNIPGFKEELAQAFQETMEQSNK